LAIIDPIACLPPTPPVLDCAVTRIYGAPIGRPARVSPPTIPSVIPVGGIAVHCVSDTYQGFLAKACVGSPRLTPFGHASFHYVIDAETGAVSSLVPEADVAWAFQSYLSNFPVLSPLAGAPCPPDNCAPPCPPPVPQPITYPGWTVLSALHPGISADFYAISIGITQSNHPEQTVLDGVDCCIGPLGLSETAYANLVRLIAWIAYRYSIPLNTQHIALHDEIVPVLLGCEECACGQNGGCLVCDVSHYCERCLNQGDPAFTTSTSIYWVYGETQGGCKVRIRLTDLLAP
jgi:hypothetical protein